MGTVGRSHIYPLALVFAVWSELLQCSISLYHSCYFIALDLNVCWMHWDIHRLTDAFALLSPYMYDCSKLAHMLSCVSEAAHSWPRWSFVLCVSCCCHIISFWARHPQNRDLYLRQSTLMQESILLVGHFKLIAGGFKRSWCWAWQFARLLVSGHLHVSHFQFSVVGHVIHMPSRPWVFWYPKYSQIVFLSLLCFLNISV